MSSTQTKKKRNTAIELWRFILAIAIVGFHANSIVPRDASGYNELFTVVGNTLMTGAGDMLLVFTIVSGYFMMQSFKKQQRNGDTRKPGARALSYLGGRIKSLLPVFIFGSVLAFVVMNIFKGTPLVDWPLLFLESLWEIFGFQATGLGLGNYYVGVGVADAETYAVVGGTESAGALAVNNGPLWFISAMFVCSFLLYWLLCRDEDLYVSFIAPVTSLVLCGYWYYTDSRASWLYFMFDGYINTGLLFVMVGMMIGSLMWLAIDYLHTIEFSKTARTLLTIANVFISAFLLVMIVNPDIFTYSDGSTIYRWTTHLMCILLCFITLLDRDGLTALLNNDACSGLFSLLGSTSLYIYIVHMPIFYVIMLIGSLMGIYTYNGMVLFAIDAVVAFVIALIFVKVLNGHKKPKEEEKAVVAADK